MTEDAHDALSFAEERLWFLHQLAPHSARYNTHVAIRIRGPLDPARLQRAVDALVERQHVLRSRFGVRDGRPIRRIAAALSVPLSAHRAATLAEATQRIQQDGDRPFDLERGPLVRAHLIQLADAEDDHVLAFVISHLLVDESSAAIMMRELAQLYAGAALAPLRSSYAEHARAERARFASGAMDASLAYWKQALARVTPPELPWDRARPAIPSHRGGEVVVRCPDQLTAALPQIARSHRVTPFMVFLAAFELLLSRYTGQREPAVGTVISQRTSDELVDLVGLLLNTVVVAVQLDRARTASDLLRQVRDRVLDACDHAHVPFDKVVEAVNPSRDGQRTPLFDAIFAFETPPDPVRADELELAPIEIATEWSKFDLYLRARRTADGYTLALAYSRDVFDESTARRMLEQLGRLVTDMVERPDAPLASLALLSPDELAQLASWNATGPALGAGETVHARFAAQAVRAPDALAVTDAATGAYLTYRDVDQLANGLAHALVGRGVRPGDCVALGLERSADAIIAILGIMKAGAAYVPVHPDAPADRRRRMLDRTRARAVVTRDGDPAWPPALAQLHVGARAAAPPAVPDHPDRLAYVMFTSGSTGEPKGVEIAHRGLVHMALWYQARFGVSAASRASQLGALAFDISALELWPYLLAGASVHVVAPRHRADTAALRGWLVDQAITHATLATPLLRELLAVDRFPSGALQRVFTGGELLKAPSWPDGFTAPVINLYGPTEATVFVTHTEVDRALAPGTPVPIGRAAGDARLHVLGRDGERLGAGMIGELWIDAGGLARGYAGDPALTAERFQPDPFGAAGGRLYRTGDRVRWHVNGELQFLGRVDRQIKLRGHRIEPGEIEACLLSHPGVREAVAIVHDEHTSRAQLVAYVATRPPEPSVAALRQLLTTRLPHYMVPALIERVTAIPLTPHGKLDVAALRARAADHASAPAAARRPLTPGEALLGQLWDDVLDRKGGVAGLDDNFFELGGHSLLATRLTHRVQQVFGRELSVHQVFQSPTLEALAQAISPPITPAPDHAGAPGPSQPDHGSPRTGQS